MEDENNEQVSLLDKEDGANVPTFTAEDAIETIGFGKFQIKLLAMIGMAWSADSLEMTLLAILAPAIRCYWNLTHWHEAFLTTIVFIGMFIATYFWGYASDNYGRKMILITSQLGIFAFGLASSFSVNYVVLVVFRGLVGACMGGVVQGTTLIVEFLPNATRGLTVNVSSIFWSLGTSVEIIMAMIVMPRYGWRVLLFMSAWPCLLFVVIALIIKYPPESVRYLISKGKTDAAMDILKKAAKDNKKDLPEGIIQSTQQQFQSHHGQTTLNQRCIKEKRGNILETFRNGYWKVTIPLWIIWFSSHFTIYGLALLTTALYSSSYTCYGQGKNVTSTHETCKLLTERDYVHFFYVLAADFPAVVITALLADSVGRKWLQAIGFFVQSVFFMLLFICTGSQSLTTFFLFGVRCFAAVADIGGYIYTPEVYPTHIRGIALGSCSGISRIGCMVTPFFAQVLTHHSLYLSLGTYALVSITGGICSLLLPIETKGKGLEEIHKDLQNLAKRSNDPLCEVETPSKTNEIKQQNFDINDRSST